MYQCFPVAESARGVCSKSSEFNPTAVALPGFVPRGRLEGNRAQGMFGSRGACQTRQVRRYWHHAYRFSPDPPFQILQA